MSITAETGTAFRSVPVEFPEEAIDDLRRRVRATRWVDASYPNVISFKEVDKGGHFAARPVPELFSTEIRAAFRSLRRGRSS